METQAETVPVDSSTLRTVAYDNARRRLTLTFQSGSVYDYFAVPPRVAEELLAAPSKGRFFNARIKDVYRYLRRDG